MTEAIYGPCRGAEDIVELLADIRPSDQEEIELATGMSAKEVMHRSLEGGSEVGALRYEGKLMAIEGLGFWGNEPGIGRVGVPWLIGTGEIDRHARAFLRHSKTQVQVFLAQYDALYNLAWEGNMRSIVWLVWLGFTMDPAIPHGPKGALFHPFHMGASVDV